MRDIETIETELIYADLEQAERRHERVVRDARGGDKAAIAEEAWLREVIDALQSGRPARTVPPPETRRTRVRDLVAADRQAGAVRRQRRRGRRRGAAGDRRARRGAGRASPSPSPSRLEAELSELDDEEAAAMREELGIGESGLDRVVGGAFALLRPDRVLHGRRGQARAVVAPARGLTAWHAAGEIHTDIQKGFVRAEVIGWDALVEAGGYAGARDSGTLRLEGRDYVMADGDVITVKFTP